MANGTPSPIIHLQPGAETLLTAITKKQFACPQAYHLQLTAERMLLIGGFDELICLENLPFTLFPY